MCYCDPPRNSVRTRMSVSLLDDDDDDDDGVVRWFETIDSVGVV